MLYIEHRALLLLSMGGGLVYAALLTLSMDVVEMIWYNTPFVQ